VSSKSEMAAVAAGVHACRKAEASRLAEKAPAGTQTSLAIASDETTA
jgi:hypothetical protein